MPWEKDSDDSEISHKLNSQKLKNYPVILQYESIHLDSVSKEDPEDSDVSDKLNHQTFQIKKLSCHLTIWFHPSIGYFDHSYAQKQAKSAKIQKYNWLLHDDTVHAPWLTAVSIGFWYVSISFPFLIIKQVTRERFAKVRLQ